MWRDFDFKGAVLTLNDSLNNCGCFSVPFFMAFDADVIHRHGPNNEICRQLQPKETKVRLY